MMKDSVWLVNFDFMTMASKKYSFTIFLLNLANFGRLRLFLLILEKILTGLTEFRTFLINLD